MKNHILTLNDQCSYHIETSQLIYRANQLTDFYMMGTLVVKRLRSWEVFFFKLDYSYIASIAKIASKKIEVFIRPQRFFLLRLLFISISLSPGLTWSNVTMSKFVFLNATCICWIRYKCNNPTEMFDPSFAGYHEHVYCRNVASLKIL